MTLTSSWMSDILGYFKVAPDSWSRRRHALSTPFLYERILPAALFATSSIGAGAAIAVCARIFVRNDADVILQFIAASPAVLSLLVVLSTGVPLCLSHWRLLR